MRENLKKPGAWALYCVFMWALLVYCAMKGMYAHAAGADYWAGAWFGAVVGLAFALAKDWDKRRQWKKEIKNE